MKFWNSPPMLGTFIEFSCSCGDACIMEGQSDEAGLVHVFVRTTITLPGEVGDVDISSAANHFVSRLEKLVAGGKVPFKKGDVLADRRRRHAKILGRAGEAAQFRNSSKYPHGNQLVSGHTHPLIISKVE